MPTPLVRLVRFFGWTAFLASSAVVAGAVVVQAAGGPEIEQRLWPTPRLWRYFFATLWMSSATVVMALALATPVAYALVRSPRRWQRQALHTLTVIPLLTMPSVYAYAWFILATNRGAILQPVMGFLGLNAPGAGPLCAAWVLAVWLWPIPALILAAAFRYGGAGAYRLACLDASPLRAFLVGALPVMRGPMMAACAVVFVLAAIDSTVAPLVGASDVWSTEMLASANVARRYARPAAYLFWQSWPMLAVTVLLALSALPGLRQMSKWGGDGGLVHETSRPTSASRTWGISVVVAIVLALGPILVFAVSLAGGRYTITQSFAEAFRTIRVAGVPTLMVAACAGLAGVAVAVALLDEPRWPRPLRFASAATTGIVVLVAILPPPLIGTSLASFFSSEIIGNAKHWNIYDNTPVTWVAAMLARFAFVPVCLAQLLNRRIPGELADQALSDGANRIERLTCARLPLMWRPLAAAGVAVAGLSLSEVAAAGLVQPPQWIGGSLAVYIDSQMHYGRHNQTIALSLIMVGGAVMAGLVLSLIARRR